MEMSPEREVLMPNVGFISQYEDVTDSFKQAIDQSLTIERAINHGKESTSNIDNGREIDGLRNEVTHKLIQQLTERKVQYMDYQRGRNEDHDEHSIYVHQLRKNHFENDTVIEDERQGDTNQDSDEANSLAIVEIPIILHST
ncbi:hypothetical protein H5410_026255 [Solanum commersonii]|uniref:Uncharacterized protein n=1 Tax=Solanum commersonii TaxID=4109 RepID=A0A9J5YVJ8_SOLCO|nr:hypothetical protein H5410_026255 [Solanum commersonii]